MNKLQKYELKIANEIKCLCEKHNINYFIDYGTLLGAVRHQGFIPWDDDFDIGMLREDYDRFVVIAEKELPKYLFLQTVNTDKFYGLPFAKVRMNNTTFLESSCNESKAHSGIYVDIFPYDNFDSENHKAKNIQFALFYYSTLLKLKCNIKPWNYQGSNILTYFKYLPFRLLSNFYSKDRLINEYNESVSYFRSIDCNNVFCSESNMKNFRLHSKRLYQNLCLYKFEDYEFLGPEQFDLVLSDYYGDYMKIPDEVNKISTHDVIVVDYEEEISYEK